MTPTTPQTPRSWQTMLTPLLVPSLAIFTALAIGAVIIVATGADVLAAYGGLFMGAIGTPRSIAYTLVEATPYIFGGLAVLIGFRGGLFNIGVEGQIAVGSMCAA
ncbi:MAG: ABC transporter permease, partial [Chloroflexi bacterium]